MLPYRIGCVYRFVDNILYRLSEYRLKVISVQHYLLSCSTTPACFSTFFRSRVGWYWHFLLVIIAMRWPCDNCVNIVVHLLTLAHTEHALFTINKIQYLMALRITATEIAISPSVLGSRSLYQYLTLTIFIMKYSHCSFSLIVIIQKMQ